MYRNKNENKRFLQASREQRHRSVFDLRDLHEIINEKYPLISQSEINATSKRKSIYKPRQFMVTSTFEENIPLQKAIAAIEERASDDELEESEEDDEDNEDDEEGQEERENKIKKSRNLRTLKEHVIVIEEPVIQVIEEVEEVEGVQLNFEIESFSEESDEEWEYLKQHELKDDSEFVEHNVELPEIEAISLNAADFALKPKDLKPQPTHRTDSGGFFNPLTGLPILDLKMSSDDLSDNFESEIEDAVSEDFLRRSISFDISEEVDEKDDKSGVKHERHSSKVEDDVLHFFLDEAKMVELFSEAETETTHMQEQKNLEAKNAVKRIINRIIDDSVDRSELITKETVLRSLLDKRKLMRELKSKHDLLLVEKSVSQFLNKKSVDHFKRKKAFSVIITEKSDNKTFYQSRYCSALEELDQALSRENSMKAFSTSKIIELENQLKNVEKQSQHKIDYLEQLIRTTFEKKNFPKVNSTIDKSVHKMSEIRKEISEVRLRLLLKQHQLSNLEKQKLNFEDIGDGLTVTEFESLETETGAIGKKLEEQITFLKRLHNTCNTNFHRIAHLKEKHKMLKSVLLSQRAYFEDMLQARNDARENVTKLKKKHNELRYEIDNVTFQNGVLFRPLLIKDYDKTVETVNKLRETNADLRRQIKEINTIIDSMAETCAE